MTMAVDANPIRSLFRTTDKHPKGVDLLYLRSARFWCRTLHSPAQYLALADRAEKLRETIRVLTDVELDSQIAILSTTLGKPGHAHKSMPTALALVREAAHRELGLHAYPVQLQGAAAILNGFIAEMATGEGKTLTIAIAAVIKAWSTRGCHVMTANDYLASRDARWVMPLCKRCGLSVSGITSETSDRDRRSAYMADIVYTTPREVAADYLRDRLDAQPYPGGAGALINQLTSGRVTARSPRLQHLECAIVDEADAVLIDDAVTPLILSGESEQRISMNHLQNTHRMAKQLRKGIHFTSEAASRSAHLSQVGADVVRHTDSNDECFEQISNRRREELVVISLIAQHHYAENRDYAIIDERIVIIDPSTGRLMPDRTYQAGLHQALEVKHSIEPRALQESLASISFQRFFSRYASLAGATGTAREVAAEFWEIYALSVTSIPTNVPVFRKQNPPVLFADTDHKLVAITDEAIAMSESGRAVLIGCQSVETSDLLADNISARGGYCAVLNAVRHEEEARVIAEAGQPGRITIATNMAGRGTDIIIHAHVRALGGLHVMVAEPLLSKRLERQLNGRCARQGEPGSTQAYISRSDSLFEHTLPAAVAIVPSRGLKLLARIAQLTSERGARTRRRQVMRDDETTDELLGFSGLSL